MWFAWVIWEEFSQENTPDAAQRPTNYRYWIIRSLVLYDCTNELCSLSLEKMTDKITQISGNVLLNSVEFTTRGHMIRYPVRYTYWCISNYLIIPITWAFNKIVYLYTTKWYWDANNNIFVFYVNWQCCNYGPKYLHCFHSFSCLWFKSEIWYVRPTETRRDICHMPLI